MQLFKNKRNKGKIMRNSFLIYTEYEKYFDMLLPEEQAKLIKALFTSFRDEDTSSIESSMEGMTKMAFAFMETQLKADTKKYKEKCEQNRENANSRNRTQTIGSERIQSHTIANDGTRTQQDIDKDLDIDNNIVVDDIQSTNITNTCVCEETTTSTFQDLEDLKSLCKGINIDCAVNFYKYNFHLLVEKVKESRYLKMFRSLSELLNKYDYIIDDKYKDFNIDKLLISKGKEPKKRTYTKEQYDSLFDNIEEVVI